MSVANAAAVERGPRTARAAAFAGKAFDREKLLKDLSALHERQGGDPAAFRGAAMPVLQAALIWGREEARKALEAGGTGRACAETLSAQMDDLLRVALDVAARWLAPAPVGAALPTMVAVGGYG